MGERLLTTWEEKKLILGFGSWLDFSFCCGVFFLCSLKNVGFVCDISKALVRSHQDHSYFKAALLNEELAYLALNSLFMVPVCLFSCLF